MTRIQGVVKNPLAASRQGTHSRLNRVALMLALFASVWVAAGVAQAQPAFRSATTGTAVSTPAFRAATEAYARVNFRAAASATTTTGDLTIAKPTGTVQADVMIASIGVRPSSATITPPSGWTLVRRVDNSASALAVYRRNAGSSEPADYTWEVSGTSRKSGGIQSFSGADTNNPIVVENGQATASALTHSTPSVTTTNGGNAVIVSSHLMASAASWTPPTDMTEGFDQQGGSTGGLAVEGNWDLQSFDGATGVRTATANANADVGSTHILALRPALILDKPAGTAVNDVMVASIGMTSATATLTPPSGWTLVRRVNNSSALAVYYKIAGASEPATYRWSYSSASRVVGGIQGFSGIDTAGPIDVENGQATPSATTHSTPSVSATVANTIVVTSHLVAAAASWTPPTGMTEGFDRALGSATGVSVEGSWVPQSGTGATGVKTATASNTDLGSAHLLVLRPAALAGITLNTPANTSLNDTMIASIGVRPSTATLTAPVGGWTLVRRVDNASSSLAVYRKLAGAAEPGSHAWTSSGATHIVGGIQTFYNADTANPINVENGQATASALTHSTPSVTTTVANTLVVTSHTFSSAATWTPPAGMTEGFDTAFPSPPNSGGQSIESNWGLQGAAGATGVKTATASNNAGAGSTHILALRPGSASIAKIHYIHPDHLNTPRVITNIFGQVVWRWDQGEPFGNNLPNENPSGLGNFTCNLRLPGQYFDKETNTHYNTARDYDPAIGRYIQSDPIGLDGGINTYAYALSNPLSYTDQFGFSAFKIIVLCKDGYKIIREVGFKNAIRAIRKGEDVLAPSKRTARQAADAAGGGGARPIKDPPHKPGQSPHYHPNPRTGSHVLYQIAAGLTISNYIQCSDCIPATLGAVGDFFNPLSIPKDVLDLLEIGGPQ